MHLDASGLGIESRQVTELIQLEIRVQLPVDADQKIQIERGRDSQRIVIGLDELGNRLFEIRAQQQRVAGLENHPDIPEKVDIRRDG